MRVDLPMLDGNLDETQPTPLTLFSVLRDHLRSRTYLFLKVRSAVPGCALRLSAAPPTTIVIELPGPFLSIFEHDCFDTEHMPMARIMSRYIGIRKLLASVSK